jgi:hypothetical protein
MLAQARARARDAGDDGVIVTCCTNRRGECPRVDGPADYEEYALGTEGIPNIRCGGCGRPPVVVMVQGGDFTWRGHSRGPRVLRVPWSDGPCQRQRQGTRFHAPVRFSLVIRDA